MKNSISYIFAALNNIKLPDCFQSAKQNNISHNWFWFPFLSIWMTFGIFSCLPIIYLFQWTKLYFLVHLKIVIFFLSLICQCSLWYTLKIVFTYLLVVTWEAFLQNSSNCYVIIVLIFSFMISGFCAVLRKKSLSLQNYFNLSFS